MADEKFDAITYDLLDQEEQDDRLVEYMRTYQRSHWEFTQAVQRLEAMIAMLPDDGEPGPDPKAWSTRQALVAELRFTQTQLARTELQIRSLQPMMPPAKRRVAALERVRARESAAREAAVLQSAPQGGAARS